MSIQALRRQVAEAESQLADLRRQLHQAEQSVKDFCANDDTLPTPERSFFPASPSSPPISHPNHGRPLDLEEYKRYGRQMIVPSLGLEGQVKLKNAKVLVVGVGGLGCPAAAYLAGAGVGVLGLMDGDIVELSNLHRQVLHAIDTVGWWKTESAVRYLRGMNPKVQFRLHSMHLDPTNALDIFEQYDLVLDCTDHPKSRYLISDTCVLTSKPLVSASALKTDGQLMTLNMPPGTGPCYRCVFPKPPPADSIISCGEGGIIGPVVGVMGVLQAAKAIEIITGHACLTEQEPPGLYWRGMAAKLLLYSAFDPQPFRSPLILKRRKNCAACSDSSSITKDSLRSGSLDYALFCGWSTPVNILNDDERVTAERYKELRDELELHTHQKDSVVMESDPQHFLIDVREKHQFDICHLPGSWNIPYSTIAARMKNLSSSPPISPQDSKLIPKPETQTHNDLPLETLDKSARAAPQTPIYIICRFGNDSQEAVRYIKQAFPHLAKGDLGEGRFIGDIKGGLHAWREVDPTFPEY